MLLQRTGKLLFWLVTLLDVSFIWLEQDTLRWFTKPLLMPLLAFWFWKSISFKKEQRSYTILLALLLSWAGDLLLQLKGFFIPGLAAFLLAHICYILYFLQLPQPKKGLLRFEPLIGLPVLVYLALFLWLLYPFLDSLKIPVTIYALTIGCMLLAAINARRRVPDSAAILFFNGALQFVLSDSLLAVHLFAFHHAILGILVMLTYASAQYLLVKGALVVAKDRL